MLLFSRNEETTMTAKNISTTELAAALANTNAKHGYQLRFVAPPSPRGKSLLFRIRSEKSKIKGASLSYFGRNSVAASWRAHGHFFDEVIAICPQAVIKTARGIIDQNGGNWQDYQVGTPFNPCMASECEF